MRSGRLGITIFLSALFFAASLQRVLAAEMDTVNLTITSLRFVERFIVTVSGVLLLVLGYRLFSKASDLGNLTAELPERIKLQLNQVGPGVFFALFGTAILVYVMSSEIEVPTGNGRQSISLFGGLDSAVSDEDQAARFARAIEVVKTAATSDVQQTTERAKQELSDSIQLVNRVQGLLVDGIVGRGAYADWSLVVSREQSDPSYRQNLGDEARARVAKVERILEGRMP